ncbi:hypothetical protein R1flu_024892 [Riccia fluitans]|uniref:Uncharacterized protein n=1 Tax=Riccia fluitans TaxID=41844 RepID=A0ABD1XW69_9MARC
MVGKEFEFGLKIIVMLSVTTLLLSPTVISYCNAIEFESCAHTLDCVRRAVYSDSGLDSHSTSAAASSGVGCFMRHVYNLIRRLLVFMRLLKSTADKETNSATGMNLRRRTLPILMELRKAGIHCRGVPTGVCGVRYERSFRNLKATLNLPQIQFYDGTDKLLLNLCAFEMMKVPNHMKMVTAYVSVMDELISTEEDV